MSDRDLQFYMARVADQAERHEDVVVILKKLAEQDPKLSSDERNLLSVAYKALTGNRRTALRTVKAFLEEDSIQSSPARKEKLEELAKKLSDELDSLCDDLIGLVDKVLLPADNDPNAKLFYEKLKADYYRYSAEFKTGEERKAKSSAASECYKRAMEIGKENFEKADPQYLGLALNYSVFLYEIEEAKAEAIALADDTFKSAVDFLDSLSEERYSEATLVLQLLKDNVALWNEEQQ